MKRILFAVIAICMIANFAMAGDDNTPKTKDGDKALLFTLHGLSNLGAGNYNGGVGGKWFISDGNAIRVALGFGSSSTTYKYTGPVDPTRADEKISGTSFSVSPAYLHSIAANGPISAYIGLQAGITIASSTDENPGYVVNDKNKVSQTQFMAAGLLGVDWFAWSNISLGAEYQLAFNSITGSQDVTVGATTTSTDLPSNTSISLGSASSVYLTASIFW